MKYMYMLIKKVFFFKKFSIKAFEHLDVGTTSDV